MKSGDSDKEAIDFLVARYGNFVLLKPPMQLNTLLLWIGPLLILVLAALGFRRYVGRPSDGSRASEAPLPLNDKELEQINAILNERSAG